MRYLNLGILAHVDAGKTTLTERLLYQAGVIDEIGSVDDGSTQTDFLPLERRRGITIKSAVVAFAIGDDTINLIDTPGHPDFIAEVERVLNVLDGAVLVISAVEGVQPQTRILMRTLQRLHIPTLLFVNKIDRGGADPERTLESMCRRLTPAIIPLGSAIEAGSRDARYAPFAADDVDFTSRLAEVIADHDDEFLGRYLAGETALLYSQLRGELARLSGQALLHPVFFGSAITGAGVPDLTAGITELLPACAGDADGPLQGTVFKVERGPVGEKIAYVRLFSGTIHTRDRLRYGCSQAGKVTALTVFEHGASVRSGAVSAGRIARLWGLDEVRIGDTIGAASASSQDHYFAPPTLETAVVPVRPDDKASLHVALSRLAEQDPPINLRQDDRRGEMYVSLYGEVQKEVIGATLAEEFGIDVSFRETSVICVERPDGTGEAVERLGKGDNPFLATIGVRVEPAAPGSGIDVRFAVEVGTVPFFVFGSVEEFERVMAEIIRSDLQQGLGGWQVTDCRVTLIESDYVSPGSSARDFRLLTPLVLMAALQEAGTIVCEPIHHFRLEIPDDTFGAVAPLLARLEAGLQSSGAQGATYLLDGDIRAARVHELQRRLPAATRGEGVLEVEFAGYQPASEPIPTRPRTDYNPLNRKEYLLHVLRHV